MNKYQILEHPSELKIKAYGEDLTQLFINSAKAVTDFLFGEIKKSPQEFIIVNIAALDQEALLVNWLSEIIFLSNTKKAAVIEYQVEKISNQEIIAKVGLVKTLAREEIKAVTYSELSIKKERDFWQATVVCDV
jgi:SHS2 domain-containing protein